MRRSLIATTALLLASPVQAGELTTRKFLDVSANARTVYLTGYVSGRIDALAIESVRAGVGTPALSCDNLTVPEIAQLMMMSIRRSTERTAQAAIMLAYEQVCGR